MGADDSGEADSTHRPWLRDEHRALWLDDAGLRRPAHRTPVDVRQQRQQRLRPAGHGRISPCSLAQRLTAFEQLRGLVRPVPERPAVDTAEEGLALGERDSAAKAEHRAEDPVLAHAALAEAARLAHGGRAVHAADDGEGVPEEVDERKRAAKPAHGEHGGLRGAADDDAFAGLGVPRDEAAARHDATRVCLQLPYEEGKRSREQDVVGVEERHVARLDRRQPEIASCADAEPHVRANDACLRPEVRHRSLGRVVDHDHADVHVLLPQSARDALGEVIAVRIPDGDDHGDGGRGHQCPSGPLSTNSFAGSSL